MILLSSPGSGHPLKKNGTLRHFTDAGKQKTIHKYNKNWKDLELDFDFGLENEFENGFEKKKVGSGGHEVNWKKKMKKDILRLFRGDGSWYENLDNTVSKIQQTIVGQLFPFLVFGGDASPPKGGVEEVVRRGGDSKSEFFEELEEFIRMTYEFLIEKSKTKYKTVTETKAQIKDLIEIILTTQSFNNSSNDYTKKLFEKFIENNNDFIQRLKTLFNVSGYNNYSFTIIEDLNKKINDKIDEVLGKIDEKLKQTEKDKVLKNSVFAILKYCLESIAATTAATTAADNEDEELLEESAQILDEDIDPNADEILSIKEFETTNNDMDAKNRSFQTQNQIDYYEKINHDIHNIMMMGTEGQREVVNHIDPKSYFEEEPIIEDIDTEMDAERIGEPEVVVNVPETIVDGYSDLSRATVFVDPEVAKDNKNVDEIFYKNNREMVDETMFLNYPRVMTEEEAEILGVMSPMKLAACAVLKYCSVPVKGSWSDTVWNGFKWGVGKSVDSFNKLRKNNEKQEKKRLEKEQKKLDTNRKQAGLAILKYCLGYEDDLLKKYEEEQKHRKQASLAILKYCLTKPVRDSKFFNIDMKKLREGFKNFMKKYPFSNTKFPEWVLLKRNQPIAAAVVTSTPETKLQNPSMAILKYCLSRESIFKPFMENYGNNGVTDSVNSTGTNKTPDAIKTDEISKNVDTGEQKLLFEELKNKQFEKEQRKAAGYSILKYCLEELGKRVNVAVTQTEEIAINPDNLPIENAEEPPKEKQENLVMSSNPYLTQRVDPDVSTVTEKEKKVEEETDKYKEQSLAVLKYCLEYEDELRRKLAKGLLGDLNQNIASKYVAKNAINKELSNFNSNELVAPVIKTPLPNVPEPQYKINELPPTPGNSVVNPQLPPNIIEQADETKEEKQAAKEKAKQEEEEKQAAEEKAKQAKLKKEQEKQRQTAGFSMLKYCLDFISKKIQKDLRLLKNKKINTTENTGRTTTSQGSENVSTISSENTSSTTNTLKPIELPKIISEYDKKLLAAIGLKFYLDFKDKNENELSSTNSTVNLSDADTETLNSTDSSRVTTSVNNQKSVAEQSNQYTLNALRENAQQGYKNFKPPQSELNQKRETIRLLKPNKR
jgi:hypothetical protein